MRSCMSQTTQKCYNFDTMCKSENGSCIPINPIENPDLIDIFSDLKKDLEESIKVLANNLSYKFKRFNKKCSETLYENQKICNLRRIRKCKEKCKSVFNSFRK